nr:hypothetical protein BaRGS_014285 [Batillaria attramentaria]
MVQIVKKVVQIVKEMVQIVKEMVQIVKKVVQIVTEMVQIVKEMVQIVKEMVQIVKEVVQIVTEMVQVVKEVVQIVKEMVQIVKEVVQIVKEMVQVVKEVVQIVKEMVQIVKEMVQIVKEVVQIVTEMVQIVKEVVQIVTEMVQIVTHMAQLTKAMTGTAQNTKVVTRMVGIVKIVEEMDLQKGLLPTKNKVPDEDDLKPMRHVLDIMKVMVKHRLLPHGDVLLFLTSLRGVLQNVSIIVRGEDARQPLYDSIDVIQRHIQDLEQRENRDVEMLECGNDDLDLPILPDISDIRRNQRADISPRNVLDHFQSASEYIRYIFLTFREDFIRPLCDAIREYITYTESQRERQGRGGGQRWGQRFRNQNVRLYENVQVVDTALSRDTGVDVMIKIDSSRIRNFNSRLVFGSLVCLSSDDFRSVIYATVKDRDTQTLKNDGHVNVNLLNWDEIAAAERRHEHNILEKTPLLLISYTNHALDQFLNDAARMKRNFRGCQLEVVEQRNCLDLRIMKRARVVAMTTTGASRMTSVLRALGPRVIMVEEAAQLRPAYNNFDLTARHHRHHIDISLFERLCRGGVPYRTLSLQHRSVLVITIIISSSSIVVVVFLVIVIILFCLLIIIIVIVIIFFLFVVMVIILFFPLIIVIVDFVVVIIIMKTSRIAEKLHDHPSVKNYPHVKGVMHDVFFLNHQHPEDTPEDSKSKQNTHEAEFLAGLLPLSTSTGGEESKVVLLSLVRSNTEGRIGYLKEPNRVCVAP